MEFVDTEKQLLFDLSRVGDRLRIYCAKNLSRLRCNIFYATVDVASLQYIDQYYETVLILVISNICAKILTIYARSLLRQMLADLRSVVLNVKVPVISKHAIFAA